jgi:hypothetical protein
MHRLLVILGTAGLILGGPLLAVEGFRRLSASGNRFWILPITEMTGSASPVPQSVVSKAPLKPLQAPIEIHVWNSFEQGQFDSNRIRLVWNEQRKGFERRDTQAINAFERSGVRNPQELCHFLLRGSTSLRVEHTAFSDNAARDYMPSEKPYEYYLDAAHRFHYNQQTYLEAVSWLPAEEVLALFAGEIPWERVSEVFGPDRGESQSLRSDVQRTPADYFLCLRRAVLKLVSAQYVVGNSLLWGSLPWVSLPKLAGFWPFEMRQASMHFELSRAAQLEGDYREVEKLTAVAALITGDMVRASSFETPFSSVRVYSAVREGKSRVGLFRRRLGAEQLYEVDESSLLASDLETLSQKRKPSSVLALHGALVNALGVSESNACALVRHYRGLASKELDFVWNGSDYTPMGGGVVLRDYTPFLYRRFEATSGLDLVASRTAFSILTQYPLPIRPSNWRDARAVVDGFDWEGLGLQPVLITNLNETMASDPEYVRKLLVAWASWGQSAASDLDIAISVRSQDRGIIEQLRHTGMEEKIPQKLFVWRASDLHHYARQYPELLAAASNRTHPPLRLGYWSKRSVLYDFPGL